MITAVDTSVVLDILTGDSRFGRSSAAALRRCLEEGGLTACEVVWAETIAWQPDEAGDRVLERLQIAFSPMSSAAAVEAARAWRRYRAEGGPRTRLIPDFLVGAHARVEADRLLTRDRGFHRRYFADLTVLDPSDAAR